MTPVLYAATERQFIDNGLGPLGELYSAEVVEKLNGELELTAYYPATGRHYGDIKQDRIILAKPNPRDDPHAFRIVSAELDIAGQSLEIIADSITNDLAGSLITGLDITDLNGDDAMHQIHDAMTVDVGIEMSSDIETKSSTSFKYVNPLEAVAGTTGSILQYWGGEMKRENGRLSMLKRRGYDNVTTFRLGKNIKGLTYTVDASSLVTRVYPYWHGQLDSDTTDSSTEHEDTYVSGAVIDSPQIGKYSHVYIKPVDASQEITVPQDTTATDIKKLVDEWAKNWFTQSANTDVDKPKVTLDITPLDLQSSTNYADKLAVLETLGLTDSVTVYVPEYGVDVTAVVNELHYDPLLEQTTEIVAGTAKVSFAESNANTLNNVQSQLAAVATQADAAAISADGKSTNYYGDQPPVGATDGDYWFYSDVNGEGIKQLQNGTWVIIVDTNLPKQLETQMVAASAATSAAIVTANSAADKASLAADSVAAVSADLTIAQSVAEQARSTATDAAASGATAMSNAATALSLASGATVKATSVGASVDSLAGTIQLKADQSVVDGLSKSASSASAELTVQAGQIAVKADSTTVNSLAGTVSSQGTQLAAQAGSLALTVSKSDLTNSLAGYATQAYTQAQVTAASDKIQSTVSAVSAKVDGLNVGVRNLIPNSSWKLGTKGWTGWGGSTTDGLGRINDPTVEHYQGHDWTAVYFGNVTGNNYKDLVVTDHIPLKPNTEYTFRAWVRSIVNTYLTFFEEKDTSNKVLNDHAFKVATANTGQYECFIQHFTTSATADYGVFRYRVYPGEQFMASEAMMVEGNTLPADWQAAPEDVTDYTDTQVSTVTQTVTALQATVADKASTSQLTQLSDSLTATIGSTGGPNLVPEDGWTQHDGYAGQGGSLLTTTHNFYTNGYRLQVLINKDGREMYAESPRFKIMPGTQYTLTLKCFGNQYLKAARVYVLGRAVGSTADFDVATNLDPGFSPTSSGAQTKKYTFTTPGSIGEAYVRLDNEGTTSSTGLEGDLYFAEVQIRQGSIAPPYQLADNQISSQFTQLQNDINLRVKSGDVISQINLDTSGVLIDGAKNHITGQTTIDSGVIKDAMIDSLSASKITAGTINAAVARIINLDVSSLVGDKTSFVQSAWNSISGYVQVDANGIRIGKGSGVLLLQSDGMHILDSYNSEDVGRIHANSIVNYPQYNGLKFDLNKSGDYMGWGYRRDDTSLYTLALSYWPVEIGVTGFKKGLNLSDDMWIRTDKTLYLRKIGTYGWDDGTQYFTFGNKKINSITYAGLSAGGTAGIAIGDDAIYMYWKNGVYNMWDVIHSIGGDQVWN
jgi:phage minor structural protein